MLAKEGICISFGREETQTLLWQSGVVAFGSITSDYLLVGGKSALSVTSLRKEQIAGVCVTVL